VSVEGLRNALRAAKWTLSAINRSPSIGLGVATTAANAVMAIDAALAAHEAEAATPVVLDHARLGTHTENMAEMRARSRAHWQREWVPVDGWLMPALLRGIPYSRGIDPYTFNQWLMPGGSPVPVRVAEMLLDEIGFDFGVWPNGVDGYVPLAATGVGL
jgi:hypothetical protein